MKMIRTPTFESFFRFDVICFVFSFQRKISKKSIFSSGFWLFLKYGLVFVLSTSSCELTLQEVLAALSKQKEKNVSLSSSVPYPSSSLPYPFFPSLPLYTTLSFLLFSQHAIKKISLSFVNFWAVYSNFLKFDFERTDRNGYGNAKNGYGNLEQKSLF